MRKSNIAASLLVTCGLMGLAPSLAVSEPQGGMKINDNDSVYIDGKTFQVIPGEAKGDAMAQIKSLRARELGPAAIIIRYGNRLYIADAQNQAVARTQDFAYDPRSVQPTLSGGGSAGYNQHVATDYAYDPRSIQPTLSGGGSAGYNQHVATDYAYDPRSIDPSLSGGGSAGYNRQVVTDFAYDPRGFSPTVSGGGSAGYNQHVATDYAYDPRACTPVLFPGAGDVVTDYAYDPKGYYRPNLIGGGRPGYNQHVATDYAYDPRDYNPALIGAGSVGYNHQVATDYAYDPRAFPIRDPNPWANNYAYDPRPMISPLLVYDPRYVEYRLKTAFETNWRPSAASLGNSH